VATSDTTNHTSVRGAASCDDAGMIVLRRMISLVADIVVGDARGDGQERPMILYVSGSCIIARICVSTQSCSLGCKIL
jgi:hypothetical protein